jgi:hypothetical protein
LENISDIFGKDSVDSSDSASDSESTNSASDHDDLKDTPIKKGINIYLMIYFLFVIIGKSVTNKLFSKGGLLPILSKRSEKEIKCFHGCAKHQWSNSQICPGSTIHGCTK